jgi:hypothetical protein
MRHQQQDRTSYRRILAAAAVVALTSACGAAVASGPVPTPTPVTADSVRAAFDNSTMKNAHFSLFGTLIHKPSYYPVTGDGVLQLSPREGLQINLRVQTYGSSGVLKMQEVAIAGRLYIRIGTGKWTSKPEPASVPTPTTYVGEEIISGTALWHARSTSGSYTYDMWIRESDGYIVQMVYASTSGKLTMNFNSYNKSPVIAIPK